ncbi:hypothetical protein CTEN210_18394 [Chaetoceros tenuissimus]|uniref:Leucine-rich repeat domain-containing protein n=1 Tax=Chaetoceros tenuissimus TaxID=426638 RepID=A0AAD3DCK1_9STRA|nr:hypothetical protein CTEN210_18394 [Chaetoceros tenuissimus]
MTILESFLFMIIVLPGVEVIPEWTFWSCRYVNVVIMADDSVQRIEHCAFYRCRSLVFVKLSTNLEYIGNGVFNACYSLTSIFIPPSCREIGNGAFYDCTKLIIFSVPHQTRLGETVITNTALVRASPFESVLDGYYANQQGRVHEWIKNLNQGEEYALHRACSAFNPLKEIIYGIVKRKGPSSFKKRNEIGMTPLDYLEANPFVRHELDQRALMKQYVLEMMGGTM